MRATSAPAWVETHGFISDWTENEVSSCLVHTLISSLGLVGLLRPRGKVENEPSLWDKDESARRTRRCIQYTVV
jgi:hypothetical protein